MNKLDAFWSKFKQESLSILYFSIVQTALYFTFPPLMNLVTPWNIIIASLLSVVSIGMYIYIFTNPDKLMHSFDLEFLDVVPFGNALKDIYRIGLIVIFHASMFFTWYKNIYGIADIFYIIYYLHAVITFMLVVNAKNRDKEIE